MLWNQQGHGVGSGAEGASDIPGITSPPRRGACGGVWGHVVLLTLGPGAWGGNRGGLNANAGSDKKVLKRTVLALHLIPQASLQ